MSRMRLEKAREYIKNKEYGEAHKVLMTLPNDPTAKRWLQKLAVLLEREDAFVMPTIEPLPYEITSKSRQQLEVILTQGEDVLWAGYPDEKRFIATYNSAIWVGALLIVPALLTACGILRGFLQINVGILALIGVVVLSIVLSLMSRQTDQLYAVTNKRLILLSKGRPMSYGKRNITQFRLIPWQDNIGDILFAEEEKRVYSRGNRQKLVARDIGMYGVKNYQAVRTLIYRVFQFGEDDFLHNEHSFDGLRPLTF